VSGSVASRGLVALCAGLLFGAGLLVSGMADPQLVLAFLDVGGAWNPALAFTMAGAIAVAAPAFWWQRRSIARFAGPNDETPVAPVALPIDARLWLGSAVFGVGWGLSGICPGPGLLLLTGLTSPACAFVAAMAAGMWLAGRAVREGKSAAGIETQSGC
jgi:uncharacterized protein